MELQLGRNARKELNCKERRAKSGLTMKMQSGMVADI